MNMTAQTYKAYRPQILTGKGWSANQFSAE